MKHLCSLILLLTCVVSCTRTYDVCVYGGTASGVIAAYSAAKMGSSVILVGPDITLGGMTTGGLGFTDIGNKKAVTGISRQFYRRLGQHYGKLEQWVFEPHVAENILEEYVSEGGFEVVRNAPLERAVLSGRRIKAIICDGRTIRAGQFIDCSYEGDLMAAAGVSYKLGREDNSVYGETYDGSQLMNGHQFPDGIDPFREPGNPDSGLLWGISDATLKTDGTGDDLVQAYNYRICFTNDPSNRIEIEKPDNYDPSVFDLLVRVLEHYPDRLSLNDWFIWSHMPNNKTDINNRGAFSTDMVGMNHSYPEASWEERERILKAHKDYTLGLLYFYGHDPRVPDSLRAQMLEWGLPKDEYPRTGHWTHQLYVRESRRMIGEYVANQADCELRTTVDDGIAMAAYQMDSHNCERIVVEKNGKLMVKNEGNVEVSGGVPYPVSYRSLTPKRDECTNLLVPVCLSASHIAYGSIRMEPVFMATGQAAGVAAAIAGRGAVQDLDVAGLQDILKNNPYLDGTEPDILIEADGLSYTLPDNLDGEYDIYAYQVNNHGLTRMIDYEISISDSVSTYHFDRNNLVVIGQASGEWEKLGSFTFSPGLKSSIRMIPADEGRPTPSDAVMLIRR